MRDVTWEGVLRGLDPVLEFVRSLDLVEEVAGNRFLHHRQRLVDLNAALKDGPSAAMAVYDTDRLAHIVALAEAHELVLIGPFLRNADPHVLRPKLRDALRGPVLPGDEDENSNHPRNILFELNCAAKLSAVGVPPILGDRPDLMCELNGTRLLIECKRALTERGARTRIAKTWESLPTEAKKWGPGTRGIAALSIGKLIQEGGQLMRAANAAAARAGLTELIKRKAATLKDSWDHRHETEVIGIHFHVITPAFLEDSRMLGLVEQTHVYPLTPEGSRDRRTLKLLAVLLHGNTV